MYYKQLGSEKDYYFFDNEKYGGGIPASIIYRTEKDGHPYPRYELQIITSDGGLWIIGYIREEDFTIEKGQAIIERARAMNKSYDWWRAYGHIFAADEGV